jgi:hypothetical protein
MKIKNGMSEFHIHLAYIALSTLVPQFEYCCFYTDGRTWRNSLTDGAWALHENSPIVQLLKNFPAFYWTRRFITCSQDPSTGPCLESHQSNTYHPILSLQYWPPTYVIALLLISFLLAFPPTSYMHSGSPHSCYMPWFLIWSLITTAWLVLRYGG